MFQRTQLIGVSILILLSTAFAQAMDHMDVDIINNDEQKPPYQVSSPLTVDFIEFDLSQKNASNRVIDFLTKRNNTPTLSSPLKLKLYNGTSEDLQKILPHGATIDSLYLNNFNFNEGMNKIDPCGIWHWLSQYPQAYREQQLQLQIPDYSEVYMEAIQVLRPEIYQKLLQVSDSGPLEQFMIHNELMSSLSSGEIFSYLEKKYHITHTPISVLPNLHELKIKNTLLNSTHLHYLLQSPFFTQLKSLKLVDSHFTALTMCLLQTPLQNLQSLTIKGNPLLSNGGVASFIVGVSYPALKELDLSSSNITDLHLKWITQSTDMPQLTHLNLSDTNITADGVVEALTQSEKPLTLKNLQHLDLSDNDLGDEESGLTEKEVQEILKILSPLSSEKDIMDMNSSCTLIF